MLTGDGRGFVQQWRVKTEGNENKKKCNVTKKNASGSFAGGRRDELTKGVVEEQG